ncbi:MAG: beta strand repeat-containing protein, partial [Ignavibacteria bacterium]
MKTLFRFYLMAMVLLTFEQGELLAQYPKKLSYQGLLLINKDTPYPDSSYEITLTLYDAAQSGSVLWKETQTLTTVNGVFDAILGEITPLNLPFDKQYWLGITINPDPEFSPRVQLVANPYSFRSDTANFAFISDTSKMSKGLTYNATGAVLSLNGKEGRLFISGGKGVTISSLGDTLLLDMQASIGPAYSSDLTLDIRRISDSTDLRIANNAVDTKHLKSNAVTTTKLADTSVTAAKINRMGAMTGQVLKWNGTTWVASNDSSKIYFAGRGIRIANDSIINVGDTDSTDDVSIDLVTTKGDVLGKFDSLYIRNGSVTSNKLNQMGATTGQILKWNGTTWAPALDSGKVYKAGLGIAISNDSIINTGDRDSSNDVTITRVSANGEVLGRFDSLYIKDGVVTTIKLANNAVTTAKLADTSVTGAKINRMGATTGQILKWNGTTWVAANDTTGKYYAGPGIAISNDTIINTGDRDSSNDVTITRSSANGEVLGKFDSLYIKDGVVTTVKLANGAVTTTKLGDTSVTGAKINRMGATTGQTLKWNGTTWAPATDSQKVYFPGAGIAFSNDTIINTGDRDSTNDLTKTTIFNGEVAGKWDSLYIKDGVVTTPKLGNNAVTTLKIADGAVTDLKLDRMNADNNDVLTWVGNSWKPKPGNFKFHHPGWGIMFKNDTIVNTGDTDSTDDVTIFMTTTKGDVNGKWDSLYIRNGSVTSNKLNQMGATTGQILKWNGTTWAPALDSGKVYKAGLGIAISNDSIINTGDRDSSNDVTITRTSANGEVLGKFDSLYIKDGVVTTMKLANGAVTAAKLNQMGATTGQILKWNGTTWAPALDSGKVYKAGLGIAISNDSIINTGDRDSTNDVTITRTSANGEVLGKFDSLYIKDGVVTTVKLANGAVTTAKLADTSFTGAKINRMGATTGQILKWNGTTWAPALDSGKVYKAGLGIAISNDSIINTGDRDSTNDVTITRTSANGEVLGKFDSLYIKDGVVTTVKLANAAVTTAKLADTSVTGAKINRMGATTGQILKWNGTTWIAANDTTGKYFAGAGIAISNDTIINLGDRDSSNDVTIDLVTTKGDVLGKFDSLYIRKGSVTSNKLNQMGATTGQILKWNG